VGRQTIPLAPTKGRGKKNNPTMWEKLNRQGDKDNNNENPVSERATFAPRLPPSKKSQTKKKRRKKKQKTAMRKNSASPWEDIQKGKKG